MKYKWFLLLLLCFAITSCNPLPSSNITRVYSEGEMGGNTQCLLAMGETTTFVLSGEVLEGSTIEWSVNEGFIASSKNDPAIYYHAPNHPGSITITTRIYDSNHQLSTTYTKECIIAVPSPSPLPTIGTAAIIINMPSSTITPNNTVKAPTRFPINTLQATTEVPTKAPTNTLQASTEMPTKAPTNTLQASTEMPTTHPSQVVATPSPLSISSIKGFENLYKTLKDVKGDFDPPKDIELGERVRVLYNILPNSFPLGEYQETIKATLFGPEFEIIAEPPEEIYIDNSDKMEWVWYITPKKVGKQNVIVTVFINSKDKLPHSIKLDGEINVYGPWYYYVPEIIKEINNSPWTIILSLVVVALSFIVFRLKRKTMVPFLMGVEFDPVRSESRDPEDLTRAPLGTKITIERSKTISHTVNINWRGSSELNGNLGIKDVLAAGIRKEIELTLEKTFQETETVKQMVELDGTKEEYAITWTNIYITGTAKIYYKRKIFYLPIKFLEQTKLEIR